MKNPTLSIITINRNNAEGLRKTIESVLSQEYITPDQLEYIIIDGASSDDSVKVINEYLNNSKYSNKISYWISEPDTGIYNAMNKGIKKANGEYCLFLNSGDILANKNIIFSVINKLNSYDIISGTLLFSDGKEKKSHKTISCFSLMDDYIAHPSTFIKTNLLIKNLYSENYKIISDYVFLFQELIFNNATYTSIENEISIFDINGLSCTQSEKMTIEKKTFFSENLPQYILNQYEMNKKIKDDNIIKYGSIVKKSNFLTFIIKAWNKIIK